MSQLNNKANIDDALFLLQHPVHQTQSTITA